MHSNLVFSGKKPHSSQADRPTALKQCTQWKEHKVYYNLDIALVLPLSVKNLVNIK